MKVSFLGTGEACDRQRNNTSILIEDRQGTLLLDCGFTGFAPLLRRGIDADQVNGVWISHLHGDHFFGLPQLLLHFYEQQRKHPLVLVSSVELEKAVEQLMELAYPGLIKKLPFQILYNLLPEGKTTPVSNFLLTSAANQHAVKSYGILIQGDSSVYYSGDGRTGKAGQALMKEAELIIHEAFAIEDNHPGHGSINACLEMAAQFNSRQFSLVHLARETRLRHTLIDTMLQNSNNVTIAHDGDTIEL